MMCTVANKNHIAQFTQSRYDKSNKINLVISCVAKIYMQQTTYSAQGVSLYR
jgi:hypothetical protein